MKTKGKQKEQESCKLVEIMEAKFQEDLRKFQDKSANWTSEDWRIYNNVFFHFSNKCADLNFRKIDL